ncbi:MAG: glutamine--tRNA ligase/YqeY domain fusion protein [Cyclobacteriaceae bacterium]|nr:glutamine--tRNA ligase/YqeY domain fusion protein [Cyclobacteriaceae bacterium]
MNMEENKPTLNFIEQIIEEDLASGKHKSIQTRFPPEPNGYLHIGHAKSIVLNFELAKKYNGKCNLRFDDTNPEKENEDYVNGIINDIQWLGYEWGDTLFTSDYFDQLYAWAIQLIKEGKAYVDDQSADEISATRGTPSEPAKESPYRSRSVEENLTLFEEMKEGKYPEGSKVLRAKIDLASPNMHMRDPAMYRIKRVPHHRTGSKWNIYPMYDFAHGQSDSIEQVTHSICTLEFENHRPLYEWFIKELGIYPSRQIEFARLNMSYTITSKRKLLQLVEEKHVTGWDDPRMPTLTAMRRRGFPAAAIRNFATRVGVAKRNNVIDVALLEHSVREELNKTANRVMGVLDPVKVVIENYPEGMVEMVSAINNPEDESAGTREIPFSREVYIDRSDFMEDPPSPRKFFRLGPDREVRLKYAYIVRCTGYEKDADGNVSLIKCEYFPDTKSGNDTSGKKVKGTLGWVSVNEAVDSEIRLYDRLFLDENPAAEGDEFTKLLNPDSLNIIDHAKLEPSVKDLTAGDTVQFERQGYFTVDKDSSVDRIVFNRTIGLRDNWAKAQSK